MVQTGTTFRVNVARLDLAFRTRLRLGIVEYFAADFRIFYPPTPGIRNYPKKSSDKVGAAGLAAPVAGSVKLVSSHE
jgi:hypothetical protein